MFGNSHYKLLALVEGTKCEGHPECKERLRIQSAQLFCCSRSLVSGVQCDVEKFPHALGPCHVVTAEIVVAMAVPNENPADCEVRGVIRFLQADEVSVYFAEEASSRVELFCCTTMHVHNCVSNSNGTYSSILRAVQIWHHRNFYYFQKWRSTLLVNASQMMKTWRIIVE